MLLDLDPSQAKDRLRITQYQRNGTLSTALQALRSGSWAKAVTPVCISALLLLPSDCPHNPSVQTALKQETARQAGESELRSAIWRDSTNTLHFRNTFHPQHFLDTHSTSTLQTTEVISAQVERDKKTHKSNDCSRSSKDYERLPRLASRLLFPFERHTDTHRGRKLLSQVWSLLWSTQLHWAAPLLAAVSLVPKRKKANLYNKNHSNGRK